MSTVVKWPVPMPDIWGGIECTINRVGDGFSDQLLHAGHYDRDDDIAKIAALGIKKLRYPILWERHQPHGVEDIDWAWSTGQLQKIRDAGMVPIAGLVHHGSGPASTSLEDERFPELLAEYAGKVARQFPWLEYYTPVNEPLTTARFSGLYGFWYPHRTNDYAFLKMLLHQVKATVLSMKNIRLVNPAAQLVQTEDLSFSSSTALLKYQATFENNRRWLTYDLLCGKVNRKHVLWRYILKKGIREDELLFFTQNPCPPEIIGLNYYVTSERWLDQDLEKYPVYCHGKNKSHRYADTEAVRYEKQKGLAYLLEEAWNRYRIPLAITECHLNCSREEQLRWFKETWDTCKKLACKGVDIKAVTAWSLLGAFNWSTLLRSDEGIYESGVFDLTNKKLRPTALAKMIGSLATNGQFAHPLIEQKGWWNTSESKIKTAVKKKTPPLLIVGKNGTLARAFIRIAEQRAIPYVALARTGINISENDSIEKVIGELRPWAMINTTGFVRVDDAETNKAECFRVNAEGPGKLAQVCARNGIPFMTFSSDLVFDGGKKAPYLEEDEVKSLNVYGASKALGEKLVTSKNADALVIRTSGFFGPWDQFNFVHNVLSTIKNGQNFAAASDIISSPTYVPDLVNYALDLFIDEESGIWHMTNDGIVSWAEFARQVALRGGCQSNKITAVDSSSLDWKAKRPSFSVLQSYKGIKLPTLENALDRYFMEHSF